MKILKLLMLSISFISASENTLLNFKWGMSIDEVKEVAKGKFEIISEVEKKNYGEILNSGFSKVFSLPKSEIESAFTVLGIENTANGMEEYWRTCLCDKFIDIHNITALGYPMSVSHASVLTLKNREGKVFLYFSNGNLEVINKVIGKKSDGHLEKELKRKYGKGTGVREGCKFIYGNELMLTNSKHYQMNGSGISLNTTKRDKKATNFELFEWQRSKAIESGDSQLERELNEVIQKINEVTVLSISYYNPTFVEYNKKQFKVFRKKIIGE